MEKKNQSKSIKIYNRIDNICSHQYCVGQFCPVFKLCVRKPGLILSPFIQMDQGRAQPNIQCEGKRISEDSQPRNGQNYHPRRGGACL